MELFEIDPETTALLDGIDGKELPAFAERHEHAADDEQIELYIYICFLIFTQTRSTEYLDRGIQRTEQWVAATPPDHRDRIRRSKILDMMLARKHQDKDVLEDAISSLRETRISEESGSDSEKAKMQAGSPNKQTSRLTVSATPEDYSGRLSSLFAYFDTRYERTGLVSDLDEAVNTAKLAIKTTPADHPNRAMWLNRLGVSLCMRFERTGSMNDIDRAIDIAGRAVDATHDDPARAGRLNTLGICLGRRFERTGSMDDLNRAISICDEAVSAKYNSDRVVSLSNLGNWLYRRFERTGSMDDLNRAIDVAGREVDVVPEDHPDRAGLLNNFGIWLGSRYERTGSVDDLNRSVDIVSQAVDATPQGHPARAGRLKNLGSRLGARFKRTGHIEDLNRAIDVTGQAVASTPNDHPARAGRLNGLAICLSMRFEQTGSLDDLNRAIEIASQVVNAIPKGHPNRSGLLGNLGTWQGWRFEQTDSIGDINSAVDYSSQSVDATPENHPYRAVSLNNLGNRLGRRFERTGSMKDLDRAVDVTSQAIDATPKDHPDRATWLNNLGNRLAMRFEQTGSMDDLDRAIEISSQAVETVPEDHPARIGPLNSLGNRLGKRFERTGSKDDLYRAIDAVTKAIDAMPKTHPDRPGLLNNLAVWLGKRSERTHSIDDLDRAIDTASRAVDAAPDHPKRAVWLGTLGNWLGTRYEQKGLMDDLNRAVETTSCAVDATPEDHLYRAASINNIGRWLSRRYDRTGSTEDLNRALSLYEDGWRNSTGPPSVRIQLAIRAARLHASKSDWKASSHLLQEAVKTLPNISPRWLKHTDKQHMLAELVGLTSNAAAVSLNAGSDAYGALQLLELGRDVIAGLLLEMRGDVFQLKEQHPNLADEFISLRDELDKAVDITAPTFSSWELHAKRHREADQRFNELMERIRTQPEFGNFLLPPTAGELMAAADPDPIVVINVSNYRCDAFLIERDGIRVLELPRLTQKEVKEQVRGLRSVNPAASPRTGIMLAWLWDVVCSPILEALGLNITMSGSDSSWPRVWWVPTGLLTQLPLHAAGRHMQGSKETVLDKVMSSYASSAKALIYGRRHHIHGRTKPSSSNHALLIAMSRTPGLVGNGALPSALDEVKMLNDLCPSLNLKPIMPGSRKKEVLEHLRACRIFHFAGHGRSDSMEPSRSCLLLEDWKSNPLTVADLRDHRLQDDPPFLGYLSACSTGANEANDLVDEGIHLISACQLAGFRHVIGTLWVVSDRHCANVAGVLYKTLRDEGMTDVAVCRGLHRAVRELRDLWVRGESALRKAEVVAVTTPNTGLPNAYWVPYVHFGV